MDLRNAGAFGTEVVLTGRYLSAEEALDANIIDRVTLDGKFLDVAAIWLLRSRPTPC